MRIKLGKSAFSAIMSVVLAVGLLPVPAYAGGGKLVPAQSVEGEGAACAVLYSNGDFVIQGTAGPDGSEGHTDADVVAAYEDFNELVEIVAEDGGDSLGRTWYDRRADIKRVRVRGNVAIEDASEAFRDCVNLVDVDLCGLDTSNTWTMQRMFFNCTSLASLNLAGIETSEVTDMSEMFSNCSSLAGLDLKGFDTSRVTSAWQWHSLSGSPQDECGGVTANPATRLRHSRMAGIAQARRDARMRPRPSQARSTDLRANAAKGPDMQERWSRGIAENST